MDFCPGQTPLNRIAGLPVVSLKKLIKRKEKCNVCREVLRRYARIFFMLPPTSPALPEDQREVKEYGGI